MSIRAKDAIKVTLKDRGVDWTVVTTLGEGEKAQGTSGLTVSAIAVAAINTFPQILMNLPPGSKITWEMSFTKNSSKGATKSAKGRKRKKKK